MTLQQLKYVLAIAKYGSVSLAARQLFIAQPSLTAAIRELEQEIGETLFLRNTRGMQLTDEGLRFLGYARQITQQMEMLEDRYRHQGSRRYFSVSTQHYTFTASAFVKLVRQYGDEDYEFSLLEERTGKIIDNVRNLKSEIGVLYLSRFNEAILRKIFKDANLSFAPLFMVAPHVFLFRGHPLAKRPRIALSDLDPFPGIAFDQGEENSFYFSEEVCSARSLRRQIIVTDRAAVVNLLMELDAYILTSGVLPSFLHGKDIVSRPLESDEIMTIGAIRHADRRLSEMGRAFLAFLEETAKKISPGVRRRKT